MKLSSVRDIVKKALHDFGDHSVMQLSAALAYNAIFSIAPFLLMVVGIAGLVLGQETVRAQVDAQLRGMIGGQSARIVDSMMSAQHFGGSILATIAGAVALILGAGGVFGQLQSSFDTIWGVKPKPGRGIKGMVRDRFLSLAMVFGICFLLLISMVASTVLAASSQAIERSLGLPDWTGHAVDFLFSLVVISALFAVMFKFLPDLKIPWRSVWGGAITTAVLFSIGKFGLAMYLGRTSTTSSYGAAGAVVIILMWIYYASIILFLGAELTQAATRQAGIKVAPKPFAVPVKTVTIEKA